MGDRQKTRLVHASRAGVSGEVGTVNPPVVRCSTVLYRDIATRYRTTATPVAAQALMQLAATYEKLGRTTDAFVVYERIAQEYSDQPQAADTRRRVRDRVAAPSLARVWMAVEGESGPLVDDMGAPSPDGRFLTFTRAVARRCAIRRPNAAEVASGHGSRADSVDPLRAERLDGAEASEASRGGGPGRLGEPVTGRAMASEGPMGLVGHTSGAGRRGTRAAGTDGPEETAGADLHSSGAP